jgi:hypothetical protein
MPQNGLRNVDNRNPVPKYNSNKAYAALTRKNNGMQKGGSFVHPGTQDLGSFSGQLDRDAGGDGRLADSKTETRHMAEDAASMREMMNSRKKTVLKGTPSKSGRAIRGTGFAALLGMKALNNRSRVGR